MIVTLGYYKFCRKIIWYWSLLTLWEATLLIYGAGSGREWWTAWHLFWFAVDTFFFMHTYRITEAFGRAGFNDIKYRGRSLR